MGATAATTNSARRETVEWDRMGPLRRWFIIGGRSDRGERALKALKDGLLWESPCACRARVDDVTASRHPPQVTSTAPRLAHELARAVALQRDRLDLDLLARAYGLSAQAHRGQKRQSGDDYVSHSVAVATILAEQQMDSVTIAAALLHDVVEDSDVSVEDIRRTFGPEVAELVDGLTKLSTLTFRSTVEEQAENYRKLLLSVAKDARVIIIKLAGRPKNLWSIYKKMKKRDKPFEEIYDLLAVRVLVNDIPECYHVLGVIHHKWTPLQERIKDYIASPKSNGYQSLHTTVFGPSGQLYEIQIRTRDMHRTAEYGIAAHWLYKENGKTADELDHHLSWFRQLIELQQDAHSPEEFLEFLKIDLYQDEIFVFTPKGDVKRLPKGATPIDFAFMVHTEVGQHCNGARVNGRISPLHRPLRNGDTIEVLTSQQAKPSRDWLAHVQTGRARQKIRQWIKQEEQERSVTLGREILAREVRRRRLDPPTPDQLAQAASALSLGVADQVEASIGRGDVQLGQVLKALYPDLPPEDQQAPKPTAFGRVIERLRRGRGIKIHGVEGLMVRYAQCCQPVPGDPVVGYVTQGRGISIHRHDCPNLLTLSGDEDRRVEIDWREVEGETFVVRLAVSGEDRRGLYADICEAISSTGTNIRSAELASKDGVVFGSVLVEVENQTHLQKVLKAVRKVKGVTEIARRDSSGPAEVVVG